MPVLELQDTVLRPVGLTPVQSNPLVSVLMANYNYARFLPESIGSVLAQTYSNWELIICDDGSTDDSLEVIEAYARSESRIRVIRKANGGHGTALNAAFQESEGEIICFLDSDDLFVSEKLKLVAKACSARSDCGFLVHRVTRITEERRQEGVWPLSDSLPEGWCGPQALADGGIVPYMPPTSGLSLRRSIANCIFPLPEEGLLASCPDQVVMRLVPLLTPIHKLQDSLSEFRLHATNTYGKRRITKDSISKEVDLCRELWNCQSRLLEFRNRHLAAQLRPLDQSAYFLYLQYLRAKLSSDHDVRVHYENFMSALESKRPTVIDRFWRYSLHLPVFIFEQLINVMLGQNALKQVLARAKGLIAQR